MTGSGAANTTGAHQISVIIPVYNGAKFLPTAIESVRAQDVAPLEIIVVNDGSVDNTAEVAASFDAHICYVEQPNKGPSAARNRGLALAHGEYIAFLDCDDCWPPDNLKVMQAVLEQEPEVDIVMGRIQEQQLDAGHNCFVPIGEPTFSPSLVAMLTRKSTFDKVGLLDESISIGEDKDWFIRGMEQNLHIRYLAEHISQLRYRHGKNMTNSMAAPETYWLDLVRKSLRRRKVLKGKAP